MGKLQKLLDIFGNVTVDLYVVGYALYAFVYLEKELRLGSVVDDHARPESHPVYVVEERTSVYLFELVGYGGSLYHLFYAGRVDIMLYLQPPLLGVCIDAPEPLLYAVEQSDLTSRFAESLSTERDVARKAVPVCLLLSNKS